MLNPTPATSRMLDANINRAGEGLRVLEDIARFVIENPALTQRLKDARHDLRGLIDSLLLSPITLVYSRDSSGDVGASISNGSEHTRCGGDRDLVLASAKRATQALRVIEEAIKQLAGDARGIESLRYRVYDLERDLLIAIAPPCPQWTLCVLLTRSICRYHEPTEIVRSVAGAGGDCIQIREKDLPDAEFLAYSEQITSLAHDLGLDVMINDRADIARLVDADGVHLGESDLPIQAARSILGPGKWIGRTCPSITHAIDAIYQGADTLGLGPIYHSNTKSKPELAGLELLGAYLDDPISASTPALAISGINGSNITPLAEIGCRGVAVSSAVCASRDPESSCRTIIEALTQQRDGDSATIVHEHSVPKSDS